MSGARKAGVLLLTVLLALASACSPKVATYSASRKALGTTVSVTLYGKDEATLRDAAEQAFAKIAEVEARVDAYSADSDIARFNADPYRSQPLPLDGADVVSHAHSLGVETEFSPALFGVVSLYDFGGRGSVPSTAALQAAVSEARTFRIEAGLASFAPPVRSRAATPGLDLGGAGKGLALERARAALELLDGVTGGLITAGSTTLVFGKKPRGQAWKVGVEDPRRPARLIAVAEGDAEMSSVSTSGDYQQYFERGGVRYHHILDPRTGRPVRGLRSLTVVGARSGLDSDILSTALFVMGVDGAHAYAKERGLAVITVDEEGRARVTPAPSGAKWSLKPLSAPAR